MISDEDGEETGSKQGTKRKLVDPKLKDEESFNI